MHRIDIDLRLSLRSESDDCGAAMILVLTIITGCVSKVGVSRAITAAFIATYKIGSQVNMCELPARVKEHGRPLHGDDHMGDDHMGDDHMGDDHGQPPFSPSIMNSVQTYKENNWAVDESKLDNQEWTQEYSYHIQV